MEPALITFLFSEGLCHTQPPYRTLCVHIKTLPWPGAHLVELSSSSLLPHIATHPHSFNMFNKSVLLIIISAAFAVALPTGSITKGPSTLHRIHDLGASISGVLDVKTPSTNHAGIADVHEVREVAHPSFQLPQVEKEKEPTVPKGTLSAPAVPQDESLVTDELPEVDASTASVLKNPADELPKILRSIIPSPPHKSIDKSEKDKLETPDASTPKPPSSPASISSYARTQPNNASPKDPDVSRIQSAVGDAGKIAVTEAHKDLNSLATNAAKGLESASSPNVKPPSLARRAESCDSDYTLTYCKKVLQSGDSSIPKLLQTVNVDTSVTGPVGLSCSGAKTADYVYPLCSKKLDVPGLALDCVDVILNTLT
ncbi:hypothetical protein F4604DRAFT_539519 [Suillus subluteus]|nr:hypothetical protein F4604DRAFT_539519 [Suillus subluteus]